MTAHAFVNVNRRNGLHLLGDMERGEYRQRRQTTDEVRRTIEGYSRRRMRAATLIYDIQYTAAQPQGEVGAR
jgi:hypothetical protein